MKLTKTKLKQIIKEELTKAEKKRKKKLEDELETLEHQWIKEATLSSALMERYGINEEDTTGIVLWHSLSESGKVGTYDMKFGNTIIRNLTEGDLTESVPKIHKRDDKHGAQSEDDPVRGTKKWS